MSRKTPETSSVVAQSVQIGQVTPADELRELLSVAEKRVAGARNSGESALELLKGLDRITVLWPLLEVQGMDLRPEAGRWETLRASVNRRAGDILAALRSLGGIERLRLQVHPGGVAAPWWRLDEYVRANKRRQMRKAGFILGGLAVLGAGLYFGLRLLFPVDPKVAEASRLTGSGERMIQGQADFRGALAEFEQAAELTPDDPEVWLRVGVVQEKIGDPAALNAYDRARALIVEEVQFWQMRASVYLLFDMVDQADHDLQAALAARADDPLTWYQLATVNEMRGEIGAAIAALEKADQYSSASGNTEMNAFARYRRGVLIQRHGVQPQAPAPATPTS